MNETIERIEYRASERQERKWAELQVAEMPTDDEFKAVWKRSHHGVERGWGMGKRTWVLSNMTRTREYQMGLWQGRVDAARGMEYSEERNDNTYNLGYHRGYTEYESNRRGWDQPTRDRFDAEYVNV